MIVKWPSVVQANSISDQPNIIEDFFPSILEMAGLKKPNVIQDVDGKSFVPLLKGSQYAYEDRFLIWYNPHKWTNNDGPGINYFSGIRPGKWKPIYIFKKGKLELYDLNKDIGEHIDLIKKEKATAKKNRKGINEAVEILERFLANL